MKTRLALLSLSVLVVVGCYASPRGGVRPAPPGPVDTLNILFRNDYSRLCPDRYDYCRAGKQSICCPSGSCCDDGTGPYCCDRDYDTRYGAREPAPPERDRDDDLGARGPCGPRSTTCSRAGVTVCCGDDEGCCADARGLYCCAPSR